MSCCGVVAGDSGELYFFAGDEPAWRVTLPTVLFNSLSPIVENSFPASLYFPENYEQEVYTKFSDMSEDWDSLPVPYVYLGQKHGIINGYPNGMFLPYGHITRAEAAAMFVRRIGRVFYH